MGQFLQQGHPCFFETLFTLSEEGTGAAMDYPIPETALDYLVGKTLNQINKCAERGVFDAHVKAGIPVIEISMPSQDAYHVGMLMYFFEVQCAVSISQSYHRKCLLLCAYAVEPAEKLVQHYDFVGSEHADFLNNRNGFRSFLQCMQRLLE